MAAMRSDLRNLASVQETYWTTNQTYYAGVIPDLPNFQYQPSQGVIDHGGERRSGGLVRQGRGARTTPRRPARSSTARCPPIPPAKVDAAVACT